MSRAFLMLLLVINMRAQAQLSDFENVDFQRADSIANHYKGENLQSLPILAHKLTSSLPTKLEQFRAIYTWVSTNISNDYAYYLKNKKKRKKLEDNSLALDEWNKPFRFKVFKKLLKEQKTVCTGYAYLVRELAAIVGIKCKTIDGYGRTAIANVGEPGVPNHSWNAVQLNNKWYLCDATWSSGSISNREKIFIPEYNDGYFLSDPRLFVKNHFPLDTTWILMKNKPRLNNFLNAPLIYKGAFKHSIIPVYPRIMHIELKKSESISFSFEASSSFKKDEISLEISSGKLSHIVKPEIIRINDNLLKFEHEFERIGQFDVHLKFAEDEIVTYTLRVKKDKTE